MKTKEVKRQEAIARNMIYKGLYTELAKRKGLEGAEAIAFVNHKIGIPKAKVVEVPNV